MQNTRTKLASYIESTGRVLSEIEIVTHGSMMVDEKIVKEILDSAERYWEDSKYYHERKKFEVGLASVSYCEGMLDALRLLRLVEFSWTVKKEKGKEKSC